MNTNPNEVAAGINMGWKVYLSVSNFLVFRNTVLNTLSIKTLVKNLPVWKKKNLAATQEPHIFLFSHNPIKRKATCYHTTDLSNNEHQLNSNCLNSPDDSGDKGKLPPPREGLKIFSIIVTDTSKGNTKHPSISLTSWEEELRI